MVLMLAKKVQADLEQLHAYLNFFDLFGDISKKISHMEHILSLEEQLTIVFFHKIVFFEVICFFVRTTPFVVGAFLAKSEIFLLRCLTTLS